LLALEADVEKIQHVSHIDNKTANMNDKNCSLSIVLTALDQKVQKS